MSYEKEYGYWKDNPELYWSKKASFIDWFKPYKSVLSKNKEGKYEWFKDGIAFSSGSLFKYHLMIFEIH